jgi:hypothetical protein
MRRNVLVVSVAVWFLSAVAYGQSMRPGPEHDKLDVAVGTWTFEGLEQPSALGPGGIWTGVERFEWLPGELFLQMDREAEGPAGEVRHRIIFAYDPVAKTHTGYWYDLTSGGAASATIEITGDTWVWSASGHTGEDIAFDELCTLTWASDMTSYTITCEKTAYGRTWTPSYEATYTKSQPSAQSGTELIAEATVSLPEEEREGAETRQLFLSATTGSGLPVRDLQVDEVVVVQDGAACTVIRLEPETDRMTIALLVDSFSSALRTGLRRFLDGLPAQHEVGLFTLAGQTGRLMDFTTDRGALREQIDGPFAGAFSGRAVLVDGLYDTWENRFDGADAWPVFVLVSHGGRDASRSEVESRVNRLASELMARGATVHTVLVVVRTVAREVELGTRASYFVAGGIGFHEAVTSYLTRQTGGIFSPISAASAFPGALSNLATDIGAHYDAVKDRYRVGYECEPPDLDTPIRAGVRRPELTIRSFPDRRRSSNGSDGR